MGGWRSGALAAVLGVLVGASPAMAQRIAVDDPDFVTLGVGAFTRGGGKNLGSNVEFRTGAELAWRFDDRSRLGVALHHISNAGLTQRNPGTETIMLNYSIPLTLLR